MSKKKAVKIQKKETAIQKQIHAAAESIPTMIANDLGYARDEKEGEKHINQKPPIDYRDPAYQKKKQTVIFGAGVLAAVILVVWFLNVRLMFARLNPKSSVEAGILDRVTKEFDANVNQSFGSDASAKDVDAVKEKVQQALAASLAEQSLPTSTPSSAMSGTVSSSSSL